MTAAPTQIATTQDTRTMTGAQVVIQALVEQGVEVIFGYPGGAVLPLYDALFQQDKLRHILVRHEQAARACGRGLCPLDRQGRRGAGDLGPRGHQHGHRPDRRADGFGAARLPDRPGADPHDRQRRLPGGGHGRHHPAVHQAQLPGEAPGRPGPGIHEAFHVARSGPARARWWSTCPRTSRWPRPPTSARTRSSTAPTTRAPSPTAASIEEAAELLARAERPIFYVGGGVINAGPEACAQLTELVRAHRLPDHADADGPRRLPGLRPAVRRHAGHARHVRGQPRHVRLRPDGLHRRPLRRPGHRPGRRVLAAQPEDPRRHRPVLDQQERRRRHRHRRRRREQPRSPDRRLAPALQHGQPGEDRALVGPDPCWQKKESYRFRQDGQHDQAADRGAPALRGHQAPGHLHHHRCRPAPDVGGPALPVRPAAALDDLGRPRHHGLRLPGRDRRPGGPSRRHRGLHLRRRLLGDEHAGDVDRDAVPAAGQELHPEQQLHGHGPPVAGLLPRQRHSQSYMEACRTS